ncbi:DMT family transporter [Flavobacterium sp.]|uniref:DMT family transporter n=1 Tax=Flavobacterium sp. TaxID=239 RepID=UPI0039E42707
MKSNPKAYLALFIVCFFWGTTYLALRIGVKDFPPFLFSGIRQFSAGLLLFIGMYFFGKLEKMSVKDVLRQALPGILLITLGNGIIGWAELYIPSGLAALIVSVMPIYIVVINLISGKEQKKFNAKTIAGFALGCIGIVLIFKDNLGDLGKPEYLWGVLASFAACFFWAIGSIYIKSNTFHTNDYSNAAIQFTSGGIGCFLFSLCFDDYSRLEFITSESLWALLYLTLIGSLLAYMSYLYAIKHLPIVVVSTYAYVNPVIAILLGVAILNEKITWFTVLALATTLYGVFLINAGYRSAPVKSKIAPAEA